LHQRNEASRAFAKRFAPQSKGNMPSMVQADVYGAVTHYLKAVAALQDETQRPLLAEFEKKWGTIVRNAGIVPE
jgi:branched-chain amino acid transport system substrate-binding protein